ncbi:hypothetical protein RI367_003884 [Sorochytrium milnesiophthora]
MKYIVEHMEEDLHEWCLLEYRHMLAHVGGDNLIFSRMHAELADNMPESLASCTATTKDVLDLGIPFDRICLLDMEATEELTPADVGKFDYMLFGGILGNGYESEDRTRALRKLGFHGRRLGPIQMTTDTAVITTWKILEHKTPLEDIQFCDEPTVRFSKHDAVELPYRYIAQLDKDGNVTGPMLPDGMYDLLKRDNDMDLFHLNA